MEIKDRAIESCEERIRLLENKLKWSNGNEKSVAKKYRAVETAKYILRAVKNYEGR